ncbi:TIM barrel protein [Paenibacillus bovis]|uniref:Glyoxylate-induced protein n=1 Tax=Paenibacillus bovis TaxID=1616788 RepID=A0A172ZGJ0_9BACL|nr:TIM barrel protein [Paenibacillus bovis]ANF96765.1 glyoxylate-induced protein [Paenibacillus bovis]
MRISYNTETLFEGRDILDVMQVLHAHDLNIIEFWSWEDKDLQAINRLRQELGMEVASIVVKLATMLEPDQRDEAVEGIRRSAEAARSLDCSRMVHTVGFVKEGMSREEMRQSLIDGLRAAIPALEEFGVTTCIEPLNTITDKELSGYYLNTSQEAFDIVTEVNHPLVKVCYDMYHVQVMEGNVLPRLQNNIRHVGHIQGAGAPRRHELFISELNYDYVFDAIKQMDYDGYVGIEYFPIHDPIDDLVRIKEKFHTG